MMDILLENKFLLGGLVALLLLVFAFLPDEESKEDRLERRLQQLEGGIEKKRQAHTTSIRGDAAFAGKTAFGKNLAVILPNAEKIRLRLAATGKKISIIQYLAAHLLVFFIALAGFSLKHTLPIFPKICVCLMLGVLIPHLITGMMIKKRMDKFVGQLPDAIDTMCRGLKAGLPISETIRSTGKEMENPIGEEFRRIADAVSLGQPVEKAMEEVCKRITATEYKFLVIALSIQRETGGNLAETFGNLGDVLRKRKALKLKIKAVSGEARASAGIIGSLPFLMGCLLSVAHPGYLDPLFEKHQGHLMIGVGLVMIGMGALVMKKMINFEI
ncbi:MAG: type II secretion system F family protein [Alphaproteobacteria bacterium]